MAAVKLPKFNYPRNPFSQPRQDIGNDEANVPAPTEDRCRALESSIRRRDEEIAALRDDLEDAIRMYRDDMLVQILRAEALERENASMGEEIAALGRDLSAEAHIGGYADAMGMDRSSPAFVSRLQYEHCRALHTIEVLSSQISSVKKNCDERVRCLEDELMLLVADKGIREARLMKEIRENQMRIVERKYKDELQKKQDMIEELRTRRGSNSSAGTSVTSSAIADDDASSALLELKDQIKAMAREKEANERALAQQLRERDETIALLRKTNAVSHDAVVASLSERGKSSPRNTSFAAGKNDRSGSTKTSAKTPVKLIQGAFLGRLRRRKKS